jgi:hypothetical protein
MNYDEPDPPRVHYSFKPTDHARLSDKDKAEHPEPVEVKEILRKNLAAESARLAARSEPATWVSRRLRDYLLLITVPNAIIAVIMYFLPKHDLIPIFGFSLMALYSLGITWLVWVVMDGD